VDGGKNKKGEIGRGAKTGAKRQQKQYTTFLQKEKSSTRRFAPRLAHLPNPFRDLLRSSQFFTESFNASGNNLLKLDFLPNEKRRELVKCGYHQKLPGAEDHHTHVKEHFDLGTHKSTPERKRHKNAFSYLSRAGSAPSSEMLKQAKLVEKDLKSNDLRAVPIPAFELMDNQHILIAPYFDIGFDIGVNGDGEKVHVGSKNKTKVKDEKSEATTVYYYSTITNNLPLVASLLSSPIIPIPFAIRFTHLSTRWLSRERKNATGPETWISSMHSLMKSATLLSVSGTGRREGRRGNKA